MRVFRGILIRALAATIAGALASGAAIAQPAPGSAARQSITGTILRVDSRGRTFDLLTGVGHAIRVERVRYGADLRVMARRADVGLAALGPGTVCRVDCEVAAAVATATGVEVLHAAPARTP